MTKLRVTVTLPESCLYELNDIDGLEIEGEPEAFEVDDVEVIEEEDEIG